MIHPVPPVVGLLMGEQRITSTRFSFHLQWSCSCAQLMPMVCLQSPPNLFLGFSLPPALYFFP